MNKNVGVLCRYVFPAVGGLCVTYLYNIVDGIFVGQGVGHAALGAVNVAVPFITFVVAVAAMLPMGGATVVGIRMSRGDNKGANDAFMTSFLLTALLSVGLMLVGMLFPQKIALWCGTDKLSDEMLRMASDYIFYYTAFSIPMLMSTCLSVFVRNDGSPGLAFWGMFAGAAANIFLDWLFIFPLRGGIIGAAVASGLGQVISFFILLSHFLLKRGKLHIKAFAMPFFLIGKICKRGIPEAISQLNTPVTAFCYNLVLARLIGDMGVSAFSVLSFIFSFVNAVLSGVAQGLQPLWSAGYGRDNKKEIQYYLRAGMFLNFVLALIMYVVLFAFGQGILHIFTQDTDLINMVRGALPVFALSFIPMAFNLILTAMFFSTKRTIQANMIAVSRGIVIKAFCIFLIPMTFGEEGIWLAAPAAEMITLGIAMILLSTNRMD